jgi:hypothetical protein
MRHGSQLKKVVHKYNINPIEIIVMPRLGFLQIRIQIDQHFTVHHADFIDDQILTILPLATHLFLFLFVNWKIVGTMSNARDVENRGTSGGGNDQIILSIECSKSSTNGSNQTTFSHAVTARTSLLTGLISSCGIAEMFRLCLKIEERKVRGIDVV